MMRCVYDVYHMYALRLQNTSESDPHSHEATKAVVKKAQKKFCSSYSVFLLNWDMFILAAEFKQSQSILFNTYINQSSEN